MKLLKTLLLLLITCHLSYADLLSLSRDAAGQGFPLSTIPWIKDYLARTGQSSNEMDNLIDQVFSSEAIKALETLPISILRKSNSQTTRYLWGKKYLFAGKYREAIAILSGVSKKSRLYPFAIGVIGHAYAIGNDHANANKYFELCLNESSDWKNEGNKFERDQMQINHDTCLLGIARILYAQGKYDEAEEAYLDIQKNSYVWPETLIEEAWNSYYLKKYNRTLGKLVTYNAPVLDFIFLPEVEVLKALAYYRMCLYDDAAVVVEKFYEKGPKDKATIEKWLADNTRNWANYAKMAIRAKKDSSSSDMKLMKSIIRTPSINSVLLTLENLSDEKNKFTNFNGKNRRFIQDGHQEVLAEQVNILGGLVKKRMELYLDMIDRSLNSLSYIKLDILGKKKRQIYRSGVEEIGGKRGGLVFLERSDKQYFWTFNREFWADELGDYVFALKSECSE